jgi:hypothetical protein
MTSKRSGSLRRLRKSKDVLDTFRGIQAWLLMLREDNSSVATRSNDVVPGGVSELRAAAHAALLNSMRTNTQVFAEAVSKEGRSPDGSKPEPVWLPFTTPLVRSSSASNAAGGLLGEAGIGSSGRFEEVKAGRSGPSSVLIPGKSRLSISSSDVPDGQGTKPGERILPSAPHGGMASEPHQKGHLLDGSSSGLAESAAGDGKEERNSSAASGESRGAKDPERTGGEHEKGSRGSERGADAVQKKALVLASERQLAFDLRLLEGILANETLRSSVLDASIWQTLAPMASPHGGTLSLHQRHYASGSSILSM